MVGLYGATAGKSSVLLPSGLRASVRLPDITWEYRPAVASKSGKFLKFVEEENHTSAGKPGLCFALSLRGLSPASERDAFTPGLGDAGARPLPRAFISFVCYCSCKAKLKTCKVLGCH